MVDPIWLIVAFFVGWVARTIAIVFDNPFPSFPCTREHHEP